MKIGLTTLPCFGAGKVSSDSFSQGFKGLCPISYFVVRRIGRFTGILHQWSSSRIFLVQSIVYAINLLFATVVISDETPSSGSGTGRGSSGKRAIYSRLCPSGALT